MFRKAIEYHQTVTDEIEKFCRPLREYLGIKVFTYFKLYKDARYILLSNDYELSKEYLFNARYGQIYCRKYLDSVENYEACLWPAMPQSREMELVLGKGYWHGVTLWSVETEDAFEGFCYLADKDNPEINEFYQKNGHILELFASHFKQRFADSLLLKAEENHALFIDGCDVVLPPRKIFNDKEKIYNFLNELGIDSNIKYEGKSVNLSKRELECLKAVSSGFSYKLAANKLNISPRTLEHHINNIKHKTGVNNKYDLIQIYNKSNYNFLK